MNDGSVAEVKAWVTAAGLAGATEPELLHGFCEQAAAAGVPLARALVLVDTLHPVHEGSVFRWCRDPALAVHGEPPEVGEPNQRALDHPAVAAQALGAVDSAPGDAGRNASALRGSAAVVVVIPFVGVEPARPTGAPADG
jgi:hypothetical protein